MSWMMERTLTSIPRLLSSTVLGTGRGGQEHQQTESVPSRSLQALIRAVDNARGHAEEETIVRRELSLSKHALEQPGASLDHWCEIFPRIIFCSVLGYDVSFSHIYALKLAGQGKGRNKRIGYLVATMLLDPIHEITIMIMGTLQRDLQSSSILDNLMALSAASELVSRESIPLMLPAVMKLLTHGQGIVREKAVYCMHAFFCLAPGLLQHTLPGLRNMLGDRDPGVLSAIITLFSSVVKQNQAFLVPVALDLVNILQQVRAHKFPSSYDYRGIPLPWLQILLLKILAHLGPLDDGVITSLIPVLFQILADVSSSHMMSLAVVDECLLTIAALAKGSDHTLKSANDVEANPEKEGTVVKDSWKAAISNPPDNLATSAGKWETAVVGIDYCGRMISSSKVALLTRLQPLFEEASKTVAKFLNSGLPNLRYLGIKALTQLAVIIPELAAHHQMAVVQCLDDPDTNICHQTLNLLHHMANPANVKDVCSKMLEHVHGNASNPFIRADVIDMVCDIGGRLAPDPQWYLHTLFPLLSLPLEPHRFSSVTNKMLQFFTRATQNPLWPAFPEYLFTAMVDCVQGSIAEATDASIKFAFTVIRFVPTLGKENVSGARFLAACSELVKNEKLKEDVVLCVQELLLRGCIERCVVLAWVRALLHKSDFTSARLYRQKLIELHALASVNKDLTSLSAKCLQTPKDFTLSFSDSYVENMCCKQHALKKFLPFAGTAVEMDLLAVQLQQNSVTITLPTSHTSVSTLPSQHTPSSQYSSSSTEGSFLPESHATHIEPGVKQVWTKSGFVGDVIRKSSMAVLKEPKLFDHRINPSEDRCEDEMLKMPDAKKELAKTLFQGLTSTSSSSLIIKASSSESTLLASTSATASFCQNCEVNSSQNTQPSSESNRFSPSQDLLLADHGNVCLNASTSHLDKEDPSLPIHSSHYCEQSDLSEAKVSHDVPETGEVDHPPVVVTSEQMFSDQGSGSNLSISDDSLENSLRDLSLQNSPVREPHTASADGQSTFLSKDSPDLRLIEVKDNIYSDYLNAVMTECGQLPQTSEQVEDGNGSLYSGFTETYDSLYSHWDQEEG